MAVYSAPEGFLFDVNTGLYVRESIVFDEAGNKYRHRMFFNADTGNYSQLSEPIKEEAKVQPVQMPVAPAVPGPSVYVSQPGKKKKRGKVRAKKKRGAWFYIGAALTVIIILLITITPKKKDFIPLNEEQIKLYGSEFE